MRQLLEVYPVNNRVLSDSIDRILIKLYEENKKNNYKSFLFTGAGANGGTTTVALNIAIALSQVGWKTVFVD